jgi:hypothetical protein
MVRFLAAKHFTHVGRDSSGSIASATTDSSYDLTRTA